MLFNKTKNVNKDNRCADKVFLQSFILTVIGVLITIAALSTSTWAWFVASKSSNVSSIEAAICDIHIYVSEVIEPSEIATASEINGTNGEQENSASSNVYTLDIEKDKVYSVRLVPYGSATTCYCIIVVDGNKYLTRQIDVSDEANVELGFEFTITSKEATEVLILKRWGTATQPDGLRAVWNAEDYEISGGALVQKTKEVVEKQAVDKDVEDNEKKAADTKPIDVENSSGGSTSENEKTTDTAFMDVGDTSLTPTDEPQEDVELTADSTEAEAIISLN